MRGELDYDTSFRLRDALSNAIASGKTRIVLDLTETTYLAEHVIDILSEARRRLRERGGAFVLVNADPNLVKTFEITGLDQLFTIGSTRDEAIAALDEPASGS